MDLYQMLEIERDASKNIIQKAYRRLSKKYHPDLNKDPKAADVFREITLAYEILMDDDRRNKYDLTGEIDPTHHQRHLTMLMKLLQDIMQKVVSSALQQGLKAENINLIGDMTKATKAVIQDLKQKLNTLALAKEVLVDMNKLHTTTEGPDLMKDIINREIMTVEVHKRLLNDQMKPATDLLAYLKKCKYQFKDKQQGNSSMQEVMQNAVTNFFWSTPNGGSH